MKNNTTAPWCDGWYKININGLKLNYNITNTNLPVPLLNIYSKHNTTARFLMQNKNIKNKIRHIHWWKFNWIVPCLQKCHRYKLIIIIKLGQFTSSWNSETDWTMLKELLVNILNEKNICISYQSRVTVTTDKVSLGALEDTRVVRKLTEANLEINILIR